MANNKFPKSVSFNLKNPNDVRILEHVKKRNFSGYVKKLILADMGVEITQSQSKLDRLLNSFKDVSEHAKRSSDTESDK